MFWAILISAWGGFLLGVIFMAVLSMTRENRTAKSQPLGLPTNVPEPAAALPPRKPEIKVMHG